MGRPPVKRRRSWVEKFQAAFRGLWYGIVGQSSFAVHFAVAFLVLVVAAILGVTETEWCILILSIGVVMTAELINSALEWFAPAVTQEYNRYIQTALDVASAAVLLASLGAAVIGFIIFGEHLVQILVRP
ncbi:MAG: diacylglycerol kinase family protein [Thermogutta sp.]|nr:diacylglycerol kinase family protein [Thermogutta sp.]HOP77554.1 diacylglycerol kinase family protein [Thermogutta sp.]HPU05844.1 diacylglycerol kinase family protein [Thermogutta sp.]HQF12337.1 diacylglycerol kinase family protein [Thermogutta sp.]